MEKVRARHFFGPWRMCTCLHRQVCVHAVMSKGTVTVFVHTVFVYRNLRVLVSSFLVILCMAWPGPLHQGMPRAEGLKTDSSVYNMSNRNLEPL